MKPFLFPCPFDLTSGPQVSLPDSDGQHKFVAVGIAEVSEVDTCVIGSSLLGTRALVPFENRCRVVHSMNFTTGAAPAVPPLYKLVLRLYRDCEPLIAPGPRAPTYRFGHLLSGSVPTTSGTAFRLLTLPFFGRSQATFRIRRTTGAADLSFVIRAKNEAYVLDGDAVQGAFVDGEDGTSRQYYDETATDTWWGGAGAAPTDIQGELLAAIRHVGGAGDIQESMEMLDLWVWGAAGGGVHASAESFGERCK